MAKRVIWQCDRCLKTHEAVDKPSMWLLAEVRRHENAIGGLEKKLWCDGCWLDIKQALPQQAKETV